MKDPPWLNYKKGCQNRRMKNCPTLRTNLPTNWDERSTIPNLISEGRIHQFP